MSASEVQEPPRSGEPPPEVRAQSSDVSSRSPGRKKRGWFATLLGALPPLLVLGGGVGLAWWILHTAPEQERVSPARSVPVVGVQRILLTEESVAIEGFGTVQPAQAVTLTPEVEGLVVAVHPALEPGALLQQGEVVLRIDPADAELAVVAAEAALAMAAAELELERGRGLVAAREWERFSGGLQTVESEARSEALALRAPQLARAEAVLATARNALAEARLRLLRTELRVPFDAVVLRETVEMGRRMGPQTPAADLAGVETFWVVAAVPLARALRLPRQPSEDEPIEVEVFLDAGLDVGGRWRGRLVRRLPDLEAQGRMARVLVAVDDPLGLRGVGAAGQSVLPVGAFVRVVIPAGVESGVLRAPREALRENGQVWVRDRQGRLGFRSVDVVWRQSESVLLRGAFESGDALITTYLSDPLPGQEILARTEDDEEDEPPPHPAEDLARAERVEDVVR